MFFKNKRLLELESENEDLKRALSESQERERNWIGLVSHFGLDTTQFQSEAPNSEYLWWALSDAFDPIGRLLRKHLVLTTDFEGHDYSDQALLWAQHQAPTLLQAKALKAEVNKHLLVPEYPK